MIQYDELLCRLESERVMYDKTFQKFFKGGWTLTEREALIAMAISSMYGNDTTTQGMTAAIALGIDAGEKTSKDKIKRLVSRGVIDTKRDEDDRRVWNISITDKGRAMFGEFLEARDKIVLVAAAQRMDPSNLTAGCEHIDADIYFNARDPKWAEASADEIVELKEKFAKDRKKN